MARASTYVSGNQAMVPASSPCVCSCEASALPNTRRQRTASGLASGEVKRTVPCPSRLAGRRGT